MQIYNKVFAVTGGGNGIGREIVLNLLKLGAYVAAIDLDISGLEETKKLARINEKKIKTYELNITNLEEVEKMPDLLINDFGRIDGLINVAGIIQPFVKINDLDYETVKRVM